MNAKHIVLDLLDEAYDDSFSAFKRWGRLATEATPGATFDMNVLPATSTFDSAFFAVPADSLADAVLPVGALDGAHSKHRYYKGVYLTLTVMTPEGTILLLAWACVPSESTASWTWFLRNCARAGLTRFFANKVIFSDRDKGLAAALAAVFPDAFSFWCAWHLLQNLYKVVKGNRACLGHRAFLFWAVVKAVTRDDYDEAMQNLRASSHAAHAYLAKLDICRYSVFAANEAGVALHGRVTSQFAESINAAMSKTCKSARFLPPLGFFQEAHVRVVNQLAEFHRRVSADTTSILLDRATTLLEKSLQDAAHLKVTWSSPTTALVVDDVQTVTVRMPVDDDIVTSLECACGIYSQYGVPCPHQVAGAKHRGKGFDYADFATLHVKAYHQRINAVAAVSTCIVCAPSIDGDVLGLKPDEADGKITPPPRRDLKKKKGPSSKHKRMKGAMELNDKKGKGKQHA